MTASPAAMRTKYTHGHNAPAGAGPSILERMAMLERKKAAVEKRIAALGKRVSKRLTRRTRLACNCSIWDLHQSLAGLAEERSRLYAERDALIRQFIHLPPHIASKYMLKNPSLNFDDLVGAGNVGLLLGCERYRPNPGASLMTYLFATVHRRVQQEARKQRRRAVHVPDCAARNPDPEFREAVRRADAAPLSLQYLGEDEHPRGYAQPEPPVDPVLLLELERHLGALPERERLVLRRRFWDRCTLGEVAQELGGVTRERVRQIELQAVDRLRRRMTAGDDTEAA